MDTIVPVIVSGGAGTRLWPISRAGHPKPFMKLANGETLIEMTYRRAAELPGVIRKNGRPHLLTVTNRDYYFLSRDELDRSGATGSFLLEPCSRNTAPAVTMAALRVEAEFGSDALMLVLSADHMICDAQAFTEVVQKAARLASLDANYLVTFGIVPNSPETGFGYIKAGTEMADGYQVEAFVEKPDLATAQQYLDSGNFYWNSGMFCFRAGQFLNQVNMYAPTVGRSCKEAWTKIAKTDCAEKTVLEIPEDLFKEVPDISVDYAVMELSNRVAVVPSNMGWSDVGSWKAVRDLVVPDAQNNRAYGDAIFVNSRNTFVQAEDRLVAVVGLNDIMVIDTTDALLVANPAHSEDVKQVVKILKGADHDAFKLHKTVCRPWGTYTVLEESPGFKIKRIEVKPSASLSLQMHHHRSEHWIVVKGEAIVLNGSDERLVKENESTYIPAGHKHRLENRTDSDLVLIEVQCGAYLGEDDIVRFQDNYGRA